MAQFSAYLFILVWGQMYVQWHCLSVTERIKERHHKLSCQSGPTAASLGEQHVCYDHSETSQQEGKGGKKKGKPSSPQPQRKKKKDRMSAAVSSPSMME